MRACVAGARAVTFACAGDAALASRGGVAAQRSGEPARGTLVAVAPRPGRLLLFPHDCPHAAAPAVDCPKVLIRGELILPQGLFS